MSHLKNLGQCANCMNEILSVRDRKDHTVGEPVKSALHKFVSGDSLCKAVRVQITASPP